MKDYLLFIDTEASGLPKNWNLPYHAKGNWPTCVQISWIIYRPNKEFIKEENHYIRNDDSKVENSATKVHGISNEFLNEHGEHRNDVLSVLVSDLHKFDPLIIGHFMQFDLHMLGADFFKSGLSDPIKRENTFCTMLGSTHLIKNPGMRFFRLEQLYKTLFHTTFENPHNAVADARATAECFFELMKRGEINEETVAGQQKQLSERERLTKSQGCFEAMLVIISLMILIFNL